MWASLAPHVKGLKEDEVISFPWEKEILKQLSLDEIAQVQAEVEEAKSFWNDYDQQKLQSKWLEFFLFVIPTKEGSHNFYTTNKK